MTYCWAMIVMLIQTHVTAYQYVYLGCYEHSEDINITQSSLKNNSGHTCMLFCFPRYRYAGTKEDLCYCGNNTVGYKVEDVLCHYDCPIVWNNVVKCGGQSRMSLYNNVRYNGTTPVLYTILLPVVVVMVNITIVSILLYRCLKNRLTIRIMYVTDTEHEYDEINTLPTRADVDEQSRSQKVNIADDVISEYESSLDDNEDDNEDLKASCAVDGRLHDVMLRFDDTYSHIPVEGRKKKDKTPRKKRTLKSKSGLKTYKVGLSKSGKVKICETNIRGWDDQDDGPYDTIQTNKKVKYTR